MTPEQQRIAIARACGFEWTPDKDGCWCWLRPDGFFCGKRLFPSDREMDIEALPDYLHDLNAMHEAENTLDHELYLTWVTYLSLVVHQTEGLYTINMMMATASQRAEAFLRTVGKWKD